jgi:hypothetical protein
MKFPGIADELAYTYNFDLNRRIRDDPGYLGIIDVYNL